MAIVLPTVLYAFLLLLGIYSVSASLTAFMSLLGRGRVAQSVTSLATDASLTADPGVASSVLTRSHTFMEIDYEIIPTVILLPSADSFKKYCCQLQAKVCAQVLANCSFKLAQE